MKDLITEILKIKKILESFQDTFFYIKDTECRYVYMTTGGEKFIGRSFSSFIYERTIFGDDLIDDKNVLDGALKNSINVVYMNRPSDNAKVYMRFEKIPLLNVDRIIGILCTVHDVTESYSNKILLIDLLFRKLNPSEKIYFYLISNDFGRKEIAEVMDTTLGTVDQLRYRILEKLKLSSDEFEELKNINFTILNDIIKKNS